MDVSSCTQVSLCLIAIADKEVCPKEFAPIYEIGLEPLDQLQHMQLVVPH